MRDIKELYSELLASCSEDGNINTDAFSKHLQDMDPAERKVLLAWAFSTLGKAIGSVFTKAATVVGDLLNVPYETNNSVHVINLTQLAEFSQGDYSNPSVFENGLKNALSQTFVSRQWPVNAAPFSEVFIAASEGRVRFNNKPGTELLILGAFDDVVSAEWENPSLSAIIKGVVQAMGYSSNTNYPGWLVIHSSQIGLTGELKQPEQVKEPGNE